jgi:hypothetical protein
MKKYTKKRSKKIKQWHKLLNINDENYSGKQKNITKKKVCYKNTNISRICESAKYTTYTDHLYNKDNVVIVNNYVSQIHNKFKKYRKYKIPMDKRTHYMADKFKSMNLIDSKHKNLITNDFYNYVNLQWMKEIVIEDTVIDISNHAFRVTTPFESILLIPKSPLEFITILRG